MKKASSALIELTAKVVKAAGGRSGKAAPVVKKSPAQLTLPLWAEAVRGVPNAVLRGALFTVNNARPIAEDRELIATVEGIEIRFTGKRWNQVDLDLFEMILHLSRLQPLGDKVEFTANAMLQALGRGTSGKNHEDLKNGIARLSAGITEIKWLTGASAGKAIGGSIIPTYYRDDDTGRHVIVLNKSVLALYENGYTHIDWEQRQALGNQSLAKWVHGFYSTHAQPFAYKVETIRKLSGSAVGRLGDFRKALRLALAQVESTGSIDSWSIDDTDLVHIKKPYIRLSREK
jgi:hypothetical protein